MPTMTVTVTQEGMTLSQWIWRTLKRQPEGLVETVLDANYGLSAATILDVGVTFTIPMEAASEDQSAPQIVRLWD